MSDLYITIGTLSDDNVVILDEPVPFAPSRVKVTVERLSEHQPDGDFTAKLEAIRKELRASGYCFRTKEEIDAQIQIERDNWEHQSPLI